MTQTNESLIQVSNLHKVFLTEEVETHARRGYILDTEGEYVAIAGLRVAASRHCCRYWLLDSRPMVSTALMAVTPRSYAVAAGGHSHSEVGFIFRV